MDEKKGNLNEQEPTEAQMKDFKDYICFTKIPFTKMRVQEIKKMIDLYITHEEESIDAPDEPIDLLFDDPDNLISKIAQLSELHQKAYMVSETAIQLIPNPDKDSDIRFVHKPTDNAPTAKEELDTILAQYNKILGTQHMPDLTEEILAQQTNISAKDIIFHALKETIRNLPYTENVDISILRGNLRKIANMTDDEIKEIFRIG